MIETLLRRLNGLHEKCATFDEVVREVCFRIFDYSNCETRKLQMKPKRLIHQLVGYKKWLKMKVLWEFAFSVDFTHLLRIKDGKIQFYRIFTPKMRSRYLYSQNGKGQVSSELKWPISNQQKSSWQKFHWQKVKLGAGSRWKCAVIKVPNLLKSKLAHWIACFTFVFVKYLFINCCELITWRSERQWRDTISHHFKVARLD